MRGRWAENARIPAIKLRLACSMTLTLSQLTKASRRLDIIKPKVRLLLEQQRAQIAMTDTRKRSHPPSPLFIVININSSIGRFVQLLRAVFLCNDTLHVDHRGGGNEKAKAPKMSSCFHL